MSVSKTIVKHTKKNIITKEDVKNILQSPKDNYLWKSKGSDYPHVNRTFISGFGFDDEPITKPLSTIELYKSCINKNINFKLDCLEDLKLSKTIIYMSALEQLIHCSPKLKRLEIKNCEIYDDLEGLNEEIINNTIESLKITWTKFDFNFYIFIDKFYMLNKLTIDLTGLRFRYDVDQSIKFISELQEILNVKIILILHCDSLNDPENMRLYKEKMRSLCKKNKNEMKIKNKTKLK